MLCQRLSQSGLPITFAGRSLTFTVEERRKENCPLEKTDAVAFVIDIESSKAAEEVIVGLRVELTDSPDSQRPKFLLVGDIALLLIAPPLVQYLWPSTIFFRLAVAFSTWGWLESPKQSIFHSLLPKSFKST